MDSPVGRVALTDLPEHFGPLAFLFPGQPKPVFDNDHVAVTREAANNFAKVLRERRSWRSILRVALPRSAIRHQRRVEIDESHLIERNRFHDSRLP